MAKGRKRRKGETFETEVRRQFGPVAERLGLTDEPSANRVAAFFGTVKYRQGGLTYSYGWDDREGYMWVHIYLDLDDARYSTSLNRLVTATRSDGDEKLLDNCRSWLVLQRAVESHARWIERLHPHLTAPDAPGFILASGGTKTILHATPNALQRRPCPGTDGAAH